MILWWLVRVNTSFFQQTAPDWDQILSRKDEHVYSIVVLDKPSDISAASISAFDYDAVWSSFESPLELRRIDYREYPVFGFLFTKTRSNNVAELERILRSDLKEYIR